MATWGAPSAWTSSDPNAPNKEKNDANSTLKTDSELWLAGTMQSESDSDDDQEAQSDKNTDQRTRILQELKSHAIRKHRKPSPAPTARASANPADCEHHVQNGQDDAEADVPDHYSDVGDEAQVWTAFMLDDSKGRKKREWSKMTEEQMLDERFLSRSLAPRRKTPWS